MVSTTNYLAVAENLVKLPEPALRLESEPVRNWAETTVGERLKWLADHFKTSPRQLSLEAKVSKGHAQNLISGAAPDGIQSGTARKYAERWGVRTDWLEHGKGQPFASVSVPETEEIEAAPRDATAAGRWRSYAARYWQFRAEASIALANGVAEAALDAAADRLGARHGDGPTEAQARKAIEEDGARVRAPAGREATADDFEAKQQPKRGKR